MYGDGETGVCGDGEIPRQTDSPASRTAVKSPEHGAAALVGAISNREAGFIVIWDVSDVGGVFSSNNECEISFGEAHLFLETQL